MNAMCTHAHTLHADCLLHGIISCAVIIIPCNLYKNIKNLFKQNYTYRYTGKLKMHEVSTISLHQFGVSHLTQVIVQY